MTTIAVAVKAAIPGDGKGDEAALWHAWREHRDYHARDGLAHQYCAYGRTVAAILYARRSYDEIEFDEYVQWAHVAVLECINRFDPGMGIQFKTFASKRIHGAILDGLERATERLQQHAAMKRLQADRMESLLSRDGPRVSLDSEKRLFSYVGDVGVGLAIAWMLEDTGMVERQDEAHAMPFYRNAELRAIRDRLAYLMKLLPSQQSKVLRWHYLQEMPFEAIARELQLSKGRISQIHKQAIGTLRSSLTVHPSCDVQF